MVIQLWTAEMDLRTKTPVGVLLIIYIICVSGLNVLKPEQLKDTILDGEVIVHWKPPVDAPSNSEYNVQMAKYVDPWAEVESCTRITHTYCILNSLIHDYRSYYKVRVQLVTGDHVSAWITHKFSLTEGKLLPPSFALLATSSTLSVHVHDKPILKKIYSFGVKYTIFLEEMGENNKTTTAYLTDDMQEPQRVITFRSLHWGREYCVSMKVQGEGASHSSSMSHKHCLLLPEQEWYIIAISSFSILAVLVVITVIAAIIICYLSRPQKTPAALKSPVSGWLPFSVGEGPMEVVTDKGWFLSSHTTEVKSSFNNPVVQVTLLEDKAEEDRRTSTDSGISIKSKSAKTNRGSPHMKQEDSGCGSLGGFQTSTSGQTDYSMEDQRTHTDTVQKREDSGCQLDSSSMTLAGQESGPLKESTPAGSYHSQSPSTAHIQVCDEEEEFKQTLPDAVLAEVVTGYRAGPQTCICSGSGQCMWCHQQGQYGSQVIKQYRRFVDSYKAGLALSSYRKTQMDSVVVDDFKKNFIPLGENFPLLACLSPLNLDEGGQDINMNHVSLSLCDVQLNTD